MVPSIETAGRSLRLAVEELEREMSEVAMMPHGRDAVNTALAYMRIALEAARKAYDVTRPYDLLAAKLAAQKAKGGRKTSG